MTIEAALLDIDGTFVDSNEFHVLAWANAFHDAGYEVGRDAIRKQIGKGADMLIPALLPDLDEDQREPIAKLHDEVFRSRYLSMVKPFPFASDFVAWLHATGLKVVLASSAKQAEVDHYVDLLRVKSFLTATTSADEVENSKPAADIFVRALEKVGSITASRALVVGDTPYDVIAAAKSGIRTIALLSGGFPEAVLRNAGAIAIYADVEKLLAQIGTSPLASTDHR